jgi:hypothetical protein
MHQSYCFIHGFVFRPELNLDADRGSNRRAETQELPRTETNKSRERTKHMPPKPGRRPSSMASPPAAGALRQAVPAGQQPQLCTLLRDIPKGPTWFSEVKLAVTASLHGRRSPVYG